MRLHTKLFILVCLFASVHSAYTQIPGKYGLLPDDEGYDQTPLGESERAGSLPLQFSLRQYCPTPRDQGSLPSCTAYALAAALTIQKAILQKETVKAKIDKAAHSVAYIYNQIKKNGDCYAGSTFPDGLNLLREKGDCLADVFAYPVVDCKALPQKTQHRQATHYKIASFNKVFERKADAQTKIVSICKFLADNKPVLVGVLVPSNFRNSVPGTSGEWKGEELHAMVITGFDYTTQTFELMNSYGPAWGDDGFCTIDFDTLADIVRYGFVMELENPFGSVR